jgi:hypothetical protein
MPLPAMLACTGVTGDQAVVKERKGEGLFV